jgi:hypothetical protein
MLYWELRRGGGSTGRVSNVIVHKIYFNRTKNGVRVKTWQVIYMQVNIKYLSVSAFTFFLNSLCLL